MPTSAHPMLRMPPFPPMRRLVSDWLLPHIALWSNRTLHTKLKLPLTTRDDASLRKREKNISLLYARIYKASWYWTIIHKTEIVLSKNFSYDTLKNNTYFTFPHDFIVTKWKWLLGYVVYHDQCKQDFLWNLVSRNLIIMSWDYEYSQYIKNIITKYYIQQF